MKNQSKHLWREKKRQNLTFLEKSFIYKEVRQNQMNIDEAAFKYELWNITVYSILKEFLRPTSRMFSLCGGILRNMLSSKNLLHYIQEYRNSQTSPFIAKDVSAHLKEKSGVRLVEKLFTRIIKESLSLTYKKGKSWLVRNDKSKIDKFKWLFAISIIPRLSDFDMLIKIDGSSFNRTTKLTHSCLKKAEETKLNNISFNSSTSLVAAIASTGHAFAWNTKGSVDCSIFLEFINKLWCFIEKWCHTKTDKCLFILDNTTIHQSRKIINFWKNIHIAFIHPYTPELAQI